MDFRKISMQNRDHNSLYGDAFYQQQVDGSYRSAQRYCALLAEIFEPKRIVDAGCGRGAWLKAFIEQGAILAVGLDGEWNSQEKMIAPAIEFRPTDLTMPFALDDCPRFDLAMSLEVAEHLPAASAPDFVCSLTGLSDVVLFGAAYVGQGGTNHINEQPNTYWAGLFAREGYVPFDLFRHRVWGDENIEFWYQQNTFLYVKEASEARKALERNKIEPIANVAFMNCVHPRLYQIRRAPTQMSPDRIVNWTRLLLEQYPAFADQIEPLVHAARTSRA